MQLRTVVPVILAALALATAWVERGNAKHAADNDRYTQDYIEMLKANCEK